MVGYLDTKIYMRYCSIEAACSGEIKQQMEQTYSSFGDLDVEIDCCEGDLCNFSPSTATYSLTLIVAAAVLAIFKKM